MVATKDEKQLSSSGEVEASRSSEEEDHEEELPSKDVNGRYAKEFEVNHGEFPWRNVELLEDNAPAYFCEISEFTRKKPDITLHYGGKDGPVVGASHYRFSRSMTCGVGSDDISMKWTKLKRHGAINGSFQWEWNGKHYTLRRAKTADYGGTGLQRLLLTHFKVTEDSGEIVGLYISKTGIGRKKGTLKIASGVSAELEILIVLGVISVRDKQSRRAKYAGGDGGGGG